MLSSKYANPIDNFQCHGVVTAGGYSYNLLIDLEGQVIIQRIKTDNTEILFAKKPAATTISSFWANRATHTYHYIHAL